MSHEHFSNEQGWQKGPGIPAGSDIEAALLGLPVVSRRDRKEEYVPFAQAVDFVKQHQPHSLERSRTIRDLRSRVADLCQDSTTPVRFFTAIGTPLDTYHGVDAFFEQGGRIATVDVSLREKDTHKADVLLFATFDDEGRVSVSEEEIIGAARKIADILNRTSTPREA